MLFYNSFGNIPSYQGAVKEISSLGCRNIGLLFGVDSWEYPLWVLFQTHKNSQIRIEHVNVTNVSTQPSAVYPRGEFKPCALIDDNVSNLSMKAFVGDSVFIKTRQFAFLNVFQEDLTGELAFKSLTFHFNKALENFMQAEAIMLSRQKQGEVNSIDIEEYVALRKKALDEAQGIETEELTQVDPMLAKAFEGYFKNGLKSYLAGISEKDRQKFQEGQVLLTQWQAWLMASKDVLEYSFKNMTKITVKKP